MDGWTLNAVSMQSEKRKYMKPTGEHIIQYFLMIFPTFFCEIKSPKVAPYETCYMKQPQKEGDISSRQ